MNIMIFGLPGSGKTTLAEFLRKEIKTHGVTCAWFNADNVRKMFDDWDFSDAGRTRQVIRMNNLIYVSNAEFNIVDFVAPTNYIRRLATSDYSIWMNTIQEGRFEDTNKIFEIPEAADHMFTDWYAPELMAKDVCKKIMEKCQ